MDVLLLCSYLRILLLLGVVLFFSNISSEVNARVLVSDLEGDMYPYFSLEKKGQGPSFALALKSKGKGWKKQVSFYDSGEDISEPIPQEALDHWNKLDEYKRNLKPAKRDYISRYYMRWIFNDKIKKWQREGSVKLQDQLNYASDKTPSSDIEAPVISNISSEVNARVLAFDLEGDMYPYFSLEKKGQGPSFALALKSKGKGWKKQVSFYDSGEDISEPIPQEALDHWNKLDEYKRNLKPAKRDYISRYYMRWIFNDKIKKWQREGSMKVQSELNYASDKTPSHDTEPPVIEIYEPGVEERDIKPILTIEKQILVKGRATDKNGIYEVFINGVEAIVSENGEFQKIVRLVYGNNSIRVKVVDGRQNSIEKEFFILRKSKEKADFKKGQNINPQTGFGDYYALLIAVQNYTDKSVSSLKHPLSNMKKLMRILMDNYKFEKKNIIVLGDPNRKKIINAFDEIEKKLTPNDNLLVFFAGHGRFDKNHQQGYWIPSDANWEDKSNWIANTTIRDYFRGIKTKNSLLISDACFSGSILIELRSPPEENPSKSIEELYKITSRKAITSGMNEKVPDHSIFLEYLLKRLEENKEKYLDSNMLYMSIRDVVTNNSPTAQKPLFGGLRETGHAGGEFIFVRK